MELNELRERIDGLDRRLVELLERRMDVSSAIADYKAARGLPVLDETREAEKLAAIRALCRPETAEGIADVFRAVMAASRAVQSSRMEERHGG